MSIHVRRKGRCRRRASKVSGDVGGRVVARRYRRDADDTDVLRLWTVGKCCRLPTESEVAAVVKHIVSNGRDLEVVDEINHGRIMTS